MDENNNKTNTLNTDNSFKNVVSKTNTTYSSFDANTPKTKRTGNNFGKTVLLPFTCGILGAGIVIGTCFGVPSIKNQIIGYSSIFEEAETNGTQINTQQISLLDYSNTAVGVAQKVLPSIVGISVTYSVNSPFYGNQGTASAKGSGVIISTDGYILTNNHVVNSSSSSSFYELGKASKITVKLYNDDNEYEATIIGTDEQTDLAVIKIEKTGLTAAELGDSDSVKVGEFSMAIGNPLGMQSSVTCGVISAVNREVTDSDGKKYTLIQTDAAINAGNSGGALVNSEGKVIGINTLKLTGNDVEGMGFAIPINSTIDIYEQLIQYNKVKRPYIGITGIELDEKTAEFNKLVVGVYVKEIEDFSSAERAGLKVGDVIIEADGKKITTMDELNEVKNSHKIGDEMKLKVNRNGQEIEITLTLAEQP